MDPQVLQALGALAPVISAVAAVLRERREKDAARRRETERRLRAEARVEARLNLHYPRRRGRR